MREEQEEEEEHGFVAEGKKINQKEVKCLQGN